MTTEEFAESYWDAGCRFAQVCDPELVCTPKEDWESDLQNCDFDEDSFEACLDELEASIDDLECTTPPTAPDVPSCLKAYDCSTN